MERLFIILLISFLMNLSNVVAQSVIVNPDGTHSTVHGNVIVNADGTHSTVHGNVIVNPDGNHSIVNENVIVNSTGTHSIINSYTLKGASDDDKDETSLYIRNSRTYSKHRNRVSVSIDSQPKQNEISYRTLNADIPADLAFDVTIDYLQSIDYFLLSLDKQAGFIQAKIYVDHKKVLSAKAGERRTLNFIIRPAGIGKSEIKLTIYLEDRYFGGESGRSYYYEEKGICNDKSVYKGIMDKLNEYLLNFE